MIIWSMTQAPIALVSALRETSEIFTAFLSILFLKERFDCWQITAAFLVSTGIVLSRLN